MIRILRDHPRAAALALAILTMLSLSACDRARGMIDVVSGGGATLSATVPNGPPQAGPLASDPLSNPGPSSGGPESGQRAALPDESPHGRNRRDGGGLEAVVHARPVELGRSRWEVPSHAGPHPDSTQDSPGSPVGSRAAPGLPPRATGSPAQPGGNARAENARGLPDVPVLCYHLNLPGRNSFQGFNVTPTVLRRQLAALRDDGYRTIRLAQLELLVAGKRAHGLPEKPLMLTFDDGAESNLTAVEPILRELNFTAVLFFYPTIISSGKRRYLSWPQARRLAASDRFEIGSHTYWHPKLPELSLRNLRTQLTKSKRVLEEKLGLPGRVTALAYPFGLYDRRVIEEARAAGYRLAFTINPSRVAAGDDPYTLNRYMVGAGQSTAVFQKYVRMRSPRGMNVFPPDGSRLIPGSPLRFDLPGVRLDSVRVTLNGRRLRMDEEGSTSVGGRLPGLGTRRYIIVNLRARTLDGMAVARQLLYNNPNRRAAALQELQQDR